MSLNRVILIGHVGNDFELKQTDNGTSVVNFRMATNTVWKDDDGKVNQSTDWHNIVAWGKLAEQLSASIKKGSHIYLEGSLRTRNYDRDHKHGKRKIKIKTYVTEVVAKSVQPLGMEALANGHEKFVPAAA